MFGSLAGKFEDIYEDNVDHYMDVMADTFSVHNETEGMLLNKITR